LHEIAGLIQDNAEADLLQRVPKHWQGRGRFGIFPQPVVVFRKTL
jgi:hypothetical protein